MRRPPKITEVLKKVSEYFDTSHAAQRRLQRKEKTNLSPGDWTYAIRGQTIDGIDIRIAVAFDEDGMLIITVIVITQRRK